MSKPKAAVSHRERLTKELRTDPKLARATGRTKSLLTHLAIDAYVALEAWQVEAIQDGGCAADAGKLIEHDTLKLKWEKKLARALVRKR